MTRIQKRGRLGGKVQLRVVWDIHLLGVPGDSWVCRSGLRRECRAGAACLGVIEAVEADEVPQGRDVL